MLRWLRRLAGRPEPEPSPREQRFYEAARRLDLSLFEDERFVTDRPCARLGELNLAADGRLSLRTEDRDVRRRYRRAVRSGRLELPIGGYRDGGLWDGVAELDARYAHNILLWLCGWNDVGTFRFESQRALRALRREHGIEPVTLDGRTLDCDA